MVISVELIPRKPPNLLPPFYWFRSLELDNHPSGIRMELNDHPYDVLLLCTKFPLLLHPLVDAAA